MTSSHSAPGATARMVKTALVALAVICLFASAGTAALLVGRESADDASSTEEPQALGESTSTPTQEAPNSPGAPTAPTEAPSSTAPPAPAPDEGGTGQAPGITAAADATATVTAFVQAWVDPTGGQAAWLERMRPHVAGELMNGLELTDFRLVQADAVTEVRLVDDEQLPGVGAQVTATARLRSGMALEISAQLQASGAWAVTSFAPEEVTAPPGGTAGAGVDARQTDAVRPATAPAITSNRTTTDARKAGTP